MAEYQVRLKPSLCKPSPPTLAVADRGRLRLQLLMLGWNAYQQYQEALQSRKIDQIEDYLRRLDQAYFVVLRDAAQKLYIDPATGRVDFGLLTEQERNNPHILLFNLKHLLRRLAIGVFPTCSVHHDIRIEEHHRLLWQVHPSTAPRIVSCSICSQSATGRFMESSRCNACWRCSGVATAG
ncbi:MAG: hypothetical protein NZ874_01155 [Fimbriimonadales bacterium]|nr:hypothetical protein [Fimbriimonadales bacterium]